MITRKEILLIIMIFFASVSNSTGQNPDCNKVKTGKFKLIDSTLNLSYLIERNDSIQTETDLTTGEQSKFHVKWISECIYELEIISGNKEVEAFYKDRNLKVEILAVTDNGYIYKATVKDSDFVMILEVFRVN
jgi:hypothetical protein